METTSLDTQLNHNFEYVLRYNFDSIWVKLIDQPLALQPWAISLRSKQQGRPFVTKTLLGEIFKQKF